MESMLDIACTNMDMKLVGCTANSSYRCKEACTQFPNNIQWCFDLKLLALKLILMIKKMAGPQRAGSTGQEILPFGDCSLVTTSTTHHCSASLKKKKNNKPNKTKHLQGLPLFGKNLQLFYTCLDWFTAFQCDFLSWYCSQYVLFDCCWPRQTLSSLQ